MFLASIHIHKYSRIAILHSQFQIETGCSETGNKDFLRRLRRQEHGFSIRLTPLVVDCSFCLVPLTSKKTVRENCESYLSHVRRSWDNICLSN